MLPPSMVLAWLDGLEQAGLFLAQTTPPEAGAAPAQTAFMPAGRGPDFQPYIFWAYGAVCLVLFLFTLWTALESRKLSGKIDYLTDRLRQAHPEVIDAEER